MLSKRKM